MKINLFILQQHTETSETREQKLDVQHWGEIHKGDKATVQSENYRIHEIRKTDNPFVLNVLCLELPNPGNPDLLKELKM